MKLNKSVLLAFGLLILTCSLYRIWPDRPMGFAPQLAMAIFAGGVIRDKKWAFLLPLLSMFISDALYQVLYLNGATQIPGFYEGQVSNYILFGSMAIFGIMIRQINWVKILAASVAAPSAFFLISNFLVWIGGGGYQRPTLLQAYADGIPFYQMSILATLIFSVTMFGIYFMVKDRSLFPKQQTA